MPTIRRTASRRAIVAAPCGAAIMLLLSACATTEPTSTIGNGVTPTPTYDANELDLTPVKPVATKWPQSTLAPQPTPSPDAGFSASVLADFAPPPTAEEFASWYGLIVTGTVTEVLPAQWSTPDGKRPKDHRYATGTDSYTIITPAVFKISGAPLVNRYGVDLSSGQIVVAAWGGKVGNDQITTNIPSQRLHLGDHLIIGLLYREGEPQYETPAGPAWRYGTVYWLESDGLALVAVPGATPVETQDLIQAIKDAAQANP